MEYIVVVLFAQGHDPVAGWQRLGNYLGANHVTSRVLIEGVAFLIEAGPNSNARIIADDIATNCLQQPDHLFVGEVTSNQASV